MVKRWSGKSPQRIDKERMERLSYLLFRAKHGHISSKEFLKKYEEIMTTEPKYRPD